VFSVLKGQNVPIKIWAPIEEVESQALDQLKHIAALPWVWRHIAVMPDVHLGKGATVGSVIAMKDAIAPSAVGVDIGCGMGAVKTSLKAEDLPDSLYKIRLAIEAKIPVGFNRHDYAKGGSGNPIWKEFSSLDGRVHSLEKKAREQLGTLGGGNHFIEICIDNFDQVWLVLHSGSRNIGKELAEIHINIAKKLTHNATLPDKDLAVFLKGTPEMAAYRNDLFWAQNYAFENRKLMFELLKKIIVENFPAVTFDEPILCHHNYVSEEVHFGEEVLVTRKGAIRAGRGDWGIIPGSMGTRSYIVQGLGNPESFNSASHGAGRRFSRGEAKRRFTEADFREQTAGVECRKDHGVLDEIPGAYKDIDQVMANQSDLVEIKFQLKQVLCVKG
jgi:tRNA-splicing ligase RtcB